MQNVTTVMEKRYVFEMLKIRFSCERIGRFRELGNPLAGMVDPGIGESPNWGIP